MTEDIKNIKIAILDCIDEWVVKASGNPFSWVDDALGCYDEIGLDKAYKLHWAWVGAWNNSNQEKPMEVFLREWATDDNIRKALVREDFSLIPGTYVPDSETGKFVLKERSQ